MEPEQLGAVAAASIGEVAWRDDDGEVRVRGVLPLVSGGRLTLAFPYAHASTARSIGSAAEVVLSVTEPRSTGAAFQPLLLRCRSSLVEDRDGVRFGEELLSDELRRYPPSRLLADSPLLRREHWWWLPRLLVDLDVIATAPLPTRTHPSDHLLVVDEGTELALAVVRVDMGEASTVTPGEFLVPLPVGADRPPSAGPAVLFGQDASFPDLEVWGGWSWRGDWRDGRLRVEAAPSRPGLPPMPGVLARWRRQRTLERGCRRELVASARARQ